MDRFLHLFAPARRAPSELAQGGRYRFDSYWDGGEVYRLDGDRLVNLTYPGRDLSVAEDGTVFAVTVHVFGTVDDLVAA